ncbi:hypothetical protein C1886_25140 [Pseudomonas sp. FW300-N1A1]|nr:hypothetical protein C1886_25140 [Pseudomonas sp. FW300-N1A1]
MLPLAGPRSSNAAQNCKRSSSNENASAGFASAMHSSGSKLPRHKSLHPPAYRNLRTPFCALPKS